MMYNQEGKELFNNKMLIHVENSKGLSEDKLLLISILELQDKLQVKVKDPTDHSFNYTEQIDLGDFEVIRLNQALDINFAEFKVQIVEMLQQFQHKEMFLKCKLFDDKCSLVFYGKSKIKTIIYLSLDLKLTNQHEIIAELAISLQKVEESNHILKKQLMYTKNLLTERESEIKQMHTLKRMSEEGLQKNFQSISTAFSKVMNQFQAKVSSKILEMDSKVSFLNNKVNILKQEHNSKNEATQRLLKSIDNMKLTSGEYLHKINMLEKENQSLVTMRLSFERTIAELKKSLADQEACCQEFSKKNRELEKSAISKEVAISQKQKAIEELSKDLVQANGMLVNFNNHYDTKCKEVDDLTQALASKEKEMTDVKKKFSTLQIKFDSYCIDWNKEKFDKIMHELYQSNQKIQELEEDARRLNKSKERQEKNNTLTFY